MRFLKNKIIGGCVENIEIDGWRVFMANLEKKEVIGEFHRVINYRIPREMKIKTGSYIFGCCDSVVIEDSRIYIPVEEYFYGSKGKCFLYKKVYEIQWREGWKEKIREYLLESNAEFVFREII